MTCLTRAALLAAIVAAALAGCSTDKEPAAAPASSTPSVRASSVAVSEPPPYTHEIVGKEIRVSTASADPKDLLDTYYKVARTLRGTLPEGGYWVRIYCNTGGIEEADHRLANGSIGVGELGVAQVGGLGGFDGVVPGAHCP
ncbi:hypothetical protein OHB12_23720 [Nocardia sp. NBC_01730]|uniref:hypothetical protein n=1 Tax=Nocardia sp. NBC_01730 TaxID=2975998 RepID=UPI002E116BCE|nr:hypothetical protein OHB12_23720 [Nocardia sp. NBC_01730]